MPLRLWCRRGAEGDFLGGVGHFLGMFQIASMPHDMTVASMKRFAAEVMPAAKAFGEKDSVAAE